jgi:hypothetical protein
MPLNHPYIPILLTTEAFQNDDEEEDIQPQRIEYNNQVLYEVDKRFVDAVVDYAWDILVKYKIISDTIDELVTSPIIPHNGSSVTNTTEPNEEQKTVEDEKHN